MSESLAEQVASQALMWRSNRHLYPGWLVAPHDIRERIWTFTQRWIPPFARTMPEFSADKQLEVLHEINWRLETSLLPLFSEIAPLVTASLESINPSTDSSLLPNAKLRLLDDQLDRQSPSWPELQRYWTALAFALLRFHREERHRDEFTMWAGRIKKILQSPEQLVHLFFEQCLFSLGEMDDDAVRRELDKWPDTRGDHTWQMRKASLLAELGELREAERLTEMTLFSLRDGLRQSTDEIRRLSHEGWAMTLLYALEQHRKLTRGSDVERDHRGRWEQLLSYRCHRWPEVEHLESRLDQPPPVPKPPISESPAFQPGIYTRSYSFAEDIFSKIMPAYQYMRLIEDAPYPPRCGVIGPSGKALKSVARWFIRYDPVRTQTLVFRLADKELIEAYFSRHRVAALPVETAAEFRTIAIGAIGQAQRRVATVDRIGGAEIAERANRQYRAGIQILSRVAVRAAPDHFAEIWRLALDVYLSPVARNSHDTAEPLRDLFESLALLVQGEEFEERLLELVELPIPGSPAFQVAMPDHWPEPSVKMGKRGGRCSATVHRDQWRRAIRDLLVAAKDDNPTVRRTAITRLWVLYDCDCLDAREIRALGSAYWDKVNEDTRLPQVDLTTVACLMLPEPKKGLAVQRFRKYALRSKLHPIQGGEVDPNRLLDDWLTATPPPIRNPRVRRKITHRRYVDWTAGEALKMLGLVREWWESSGRSQGTSFRSSSPLSLLFGSDQHFVARIELILDVLRRIVIPRVRRDSSSVEALLEFINEMDREGLSIAAVLPAMLLLRPEEDVASRLRHALASPDSNTYMSALRGLIYWLENQPMTDISNRSGQLPRPPQDLLQELGTIIAGRRQPGLRNALDAVIVVLRDYPHAVDQPFRQSLLIGLDYLFGETAYRPFEDSNQRIPYDEVPECRRMVARIAALLSRSDAVVPQIVKKWIESASADPLPEVREAVTSAFVD